MAQITTAMRGAELIEGTIYNKAQQFMTYALPAESIARYMAQRNPIKYVQEAILDSHLGQNLLKNI